jgi:arabinose-5-phosphate isomerase
VIRPDALVEEAVATMNAGKITSLFVVADDRPVGIVHVHDCLRAGVT